MSHHDGTAPTRNKNDTARHGTSVHDRLEALGNLVKQHMALFF
jgi:hypothetical protein